jgi:hypothetical protein
MKEISRTNSVRHDLCLRIGPIWPSSAPIGRSTAASVQQLAGRRKKKFSLKSGKLHSLSLEADFCNRKQEMSEISILCFNSYEHNK